MGSHLSVAGRGFVSYDSRLMRAIDRNDNETVIYLIQRKLVDLDKIERGHTALNLAIHKRNKAVVNLLLTAGCNVNICDTINLMLPPLLQTVMLGRHEFMRALVESGASVDIKSPENGNTALHVAVIHSSSNRHWKTNEIVKYLVSEGADVNATNNSGNTVLHLCAKLGNISTMDYLLQITGCKLDIQNAHAKNTPLHEALEAQHEEAALRLISAGCDINMKTAIGCCPLRLAVRKQCSEVFSTLLHQEGIDINAANTYGLTALHEACLKGRQSNVDLLIEHGAKVNEQDSLGNTPLHIAARQGHHTVVDSLLAAKADYQLCNKDGKSPFYLGVAAGKMQVVRLLIERGVDINQTDKVNKSPLHAAVYQGNTEMVKVLISEGADVNSVDKHGRTPLLLASKHGRYDEAKCLVEAHANPDLYASDDKGPLHMAVLFPKLDFPMISLLLEVGCDPLNLSNFIDWILFNGIVKLADFQRSELHEWYSSVRRNPTSLKDQCRASIQALLRKRYHDDQYRPFVSQVPLPKSLQNYLCVKML